MKENRSWGLITSRALTKVGMERLEREVPRASLDPIQTFSKTHSGKHKQLKDFSLPAFSFSYFFPNFFLGFAQCKQTQKQGGKGGFSSVVGAGSVQAPAGRAGCPLGRRCGSAGVCHAAWFIAVAAASRC